MDAIRKAPSDAVTAWPAHSPDEEGDVRGGGGRIHITDKEGVMCAVCWWWWSYNDKEGVMCAVMLVVVMVEGHSPDKESGDVGGGDGGGHIHLTRGSDVGGDDGERTHSLTRKQ